MLSSALAPLLIFVLGAVSVGGLLAAVFYPRVAGRSLLDRQIELIAGSPSAASRQAASADDSARKRSVDDTLREAEEKRRAKTKKNARPSLLTRLRQADLNWTRNTYALICLVTGLVSAVAILAGTGLGLLPTVGFGLSGGLLLPHLYVSFRRNRRFKKFGAEFPNAVDIIVRGIKTGLPLVDCLKIVAKETQAPVKGEFKTIVEDQTLGLPLAEAVLRLPERIPVSEASFFAIVIAIQSKTGGNLSEALGNLSKVLRERKKMQSKIKSMSAEAKASGGIIAALPFIVGGIVYLTSPAYISLLFTTLTGNLVLAASAVWMLIGILVMRKMINFDI